MKIKIKDLMEKIQNVRAEIVNSVEVDNLFKDNKEMELLNSLFDDVANEADMETFIWHSVDDFVSNKLSIEDIFLARKEYSLSDKISEILSEGDNTLSENSVDAIDKLLEGAAFRYMLQVASNNENLLLQVYLLDNLFCSLIGLDKEMELDASEYGTYDNEECLLDDFIDELISNIPRGAKIIQIEDNHEEALANFFQLEI